MLTSAKTLLTSAALLFVSHTAIASTVVGSTPAEFNVSGGQASYSIPIQVAPGRGGMQPDLSLNYTGGGNGVLGVGWSLGGLSSVHRCAANLEQDGFIAGITFSSKDRYCLDGQRLIPVNGANGAIGAEYRTEIDGYAQVKSYGGTVNNPSYWMAKTKAGQVITFGGGSGNAGKASLIFPQGTTAWGVREINDSTGNNPVSYTYSTDQNTQYLDEISYAGGKTEVLYETRDDTKISFFLGNQIQQIKRVSQFRSFVNTTHIREYRINYTNMGVNNYSTIDSIEECDGVNQCLNPINVEMSDSGINHFSPFIHNTPSPNPNYGHADWSFAGMHDTNGDALPDAVWVYSSKTANAGTRVAVSLANKDGTYASLVQSTVANNGNFNGNGWSFSGMYDVNNDQLADAVWTYSSTTHNSGTRVAVSLSQGNGQYGSFSISVGVNSGNYSGNGWAFAEMIDVNDDGVLDVIWTYSSTTHNAGTRVAVGLGQGNGQFDAFIFNYPVSSGNYSANGWEFAGMYDVNHDGLPDALWSYSSITGSSGARIAVSINQGNGQYSAFIYSSPAVGGNYGAGGYSFQGMYDTNSDGIVDAIWIYSGTSNNWGTRVAVSLGNGDGTYAPFIISSPKTKGNYGTGGYSFRGMHDTNGDGIVDAIWIYSGTTNKWGTRVAVSLGKGDGRYSAFIINSPSTGGNWQANGYSYKGMKDVNADGYLDAIWIYSSTSSNWGSRVSVSLGQGNGLFSKMVTSAPATGGNFGVGGWTFSDFHDVDGNGLLDAIWQYKGSQGLRISPSLSEFQSPRLQSITDSNGNATHLTYKPLTDSTVYTKGTSAQYPVVDLIYPQYVVSQVETSNGVGGTSTVNYQYEGLKMHVRGRGSYGYAKITESYPDTGKSQETYFNQTAFPLAGNVDRVVEKLNGQIINESQKTFAVAENNGVYTVNLDQSTDKSYELNGDLVTTVTTSHSNVDAYGNIGMVSVTTSGNGANGVNESFTKSTDSTYYNDTTNWYLGRLSESTVTHQAPNQANQQRRSQFTYDSSTGLLSSESVVSIATGLPLTTTSYQYDAYGHKTQVTVSAANETSRTSTTTYNSEGKPTQSCNQLNQCESYTYTPEGWVQSTTGPNGITTSWEYDGFGRKTKEIRADGTETTIANHFASPSSGTGHCGILATHAYTCSISQSTGSQPAIVQYDALGRELRKIATGFDGRLIYSDTEYNHLAQVTRVSRNYFMGDQVYWANSQYDDLGRVTQMDEPAPHGTRNIIATAYNGLNTTVTSGPEQRQKTTQTNAIGQVIYRGEEEGSYVEYTYTADGNLKTTTVAGDASTTITLSYDEFGRKIGMDDPDMGVWSYVYNAFGQLISQTDAKNQTTTMSYDILGRMVSRTDDFQGAAEAISTWVYGDAIGSNPAPQGSIGKLLSETLSHPINGGITKSYYYDHLGRPEEATTSIDPHSINGEAPLEQNFSTQTLYDSLGRVSRTIYPGSDNFYTENLYNANGFLEKVRGLRSNSEQYDLSQLTPLVSDAITLANNYQTQANALNTIGLEYQQKITEYQALINNGTTTGSLDSSLQVNLTSHQTQLDADVGNANFVPTIKVFGTPSADQLTGSAADEVFYTGGVNAGTESLWGYGGSDRILLSENDAYRPDTADNNDAHYRVRDFIIDNVNTNPEADVVDIRRFLVGNPTLDRHNIGNYLHVVSNPFGWSHTRTSLFINREGDFSVADRAALTANASAGRHGADLYLEFQGYGGNNNFATLTGYADNSAEQIGALVDLGFLDLGNTYSSDNGGSFYGHLNNTLVELQTVNDLINTQVQDYQHVVEQLTVLAEQTLAAADNSFQYERTLTRGSQVYTQLVNDTQYTNYWQAIDVDASGRISAEVYGNGIVNDYTYNQATGQLQQLHSSLLVVDPIRHLEYQYDAYQNVTSRDDHANDIRETYEYDRLDRLTRTDITSATYISTEFNGSQTQDYDVLGNITHKSDVGAYTYGTGITNGAGIHAVVGAGNKSYQYDANGNMISGDGRTVAWSSFNKPTLITKNGKSADFSYDASRSRYKKVNHLGDTTLYVGSLYEKLTKNAGAANESIDEKHYIYANGQLVAEHIVSTTAGVQTRYLHKDALGSVDLITDAHANVVDRRSFDAWGKLRNLTWKDNEGITNPLYLTQLPFTNKGFTGHESIQEVDLIHMNGRVYDATLARFMSADPHIQEGALTQSYNRYSYVMNNPLKYTDPSGYFFKKLFRAVKKFVKKQIKQIKKDFDRIKPFVGVIVGVLLTAFCPPCGAMMIGAISGAVGAAANGGNILRGALVGAFTAGASKYIGGAKGVFGAKRAFDIGRSLAHGVVGGVANVIQGGKFGTGFMSSAFTKYISDPIQGVAGKISESTGVASEIVGAFGAGLVGGTASVLGGGKFANGAQTAAIQYLFNQVASSKKKSYAITDEERQLVADGDVEGFWQSRSASGDPVSVAGLGSLNPSGGVIDYLFGGTSINNRLQAFANVYNNGVLNIDQVRVDLARAHINFTDNDTAGVIGLLNPEQIAKYHHSVFERHGLPPTTFGGTPFTGAAKEANYTRAFWCGGCD